MILMEFYGLRNIFVTLAQLYRIKSDSPLFIDHNLQIP